MVLFCCQPILQALPPDFLVNPTGKLPDWSCIPGERAPHFELNAGRPSTSGAADAAGCFTLPSSYKVGQRPGKRSAGEWLSRPNQKTPGLRHERTVEQEGAPPVGNAAMLTRTIRYTVRFQGSFLLGGFDQQLPAGEYQVERDEEIIEGLSWLAWRGVSTFIHLPAVGTETLKSQMKQIDPRELEDALDRDRKLS